MILKRILILLFCFVISISAVAILCVFTRHKKNDKNNFIRLLPSHKITLGNVLDLKSTAWSFAGSRKDSIYLANLYAPNQLLRIDSSLFDSVRIKLFFPDKTRLSKGYFHIVDSASFYTLDGNQPILFESKKPSMNLKEASKPPYFTQGVYNSNTSFILRVVQNGQNRLIKYYTDSIRFSSSSNLLEKQVDGIFCTDGSLIKVPNANKLIYVYYYRNQFLCIDDNLHLLYKGKTIDTISHAQIKVAYVKSLNETTLAAPPLYVNKQCAANDKYLFVHSGLIADNEIAKALENVSVVDVYAIADGKYQFSFYLPDFRGFKIRDFKVYDQSLYALYDHYLHKIQLNF